MVRLGINVPDELLSRLQPLRDSLNVSQVCRDVLEAQAAAFERAEARLSEADLASLIQRFYVEYAAKDVEWETLGHQDAKIWVESASFADLQRGFHNTRIAGRPLFPALSESWISRALKLREYFESHSDFEPGVDWFGRAEEAYRNGWLSYVRVIWKKVQAEIAKEHAQVAKRRGEKIRDATAPPNLLGSSGFRQRRE